MFIIFLILLCLNIMALGCMSDIRKLTPKTTLIDFCLATKLRRVIMLIPPISFVIGTLGILWFFVYCIYQITINFIQGD